jgi:plasmid stabilization system protein ParE
LKYSFHPAAEAELNEAVDYYDECQKGLGQEFLKEIYRAVQNILTFPYAWSPLSANTRRCLSKRFPYGVVYQVVSNDEVFIIAVMNLNREPDYWKGREKKA